MFRHYNGAEQFKYLDGLPPSCKFQNVLWNRSQPVLFNFLQEFCNGGELFRRMEVERMMTEDVARFYLCEIVCAIEYLHDQDIVYRDLKTENVMLDSTGHVRLIDFGLSKMNMSEGVTTNTFCGTGNKPFLSAYLNPPCTQLYMI